MTKVMNLLRIAWEIICVLAEIIIDNRKEGK